MNKEIDFEVEELGVASVETKGLPVTGNEPQGLRSQIGISDAD